MIEVSRRRWMWTAAAAGGGYVSSAITLILLMADVDVQGWWILLSMLVQGIGTYKLLRLVLQWLKGPTT